MSIAMPGPWKHPTTSTFYLKQRVPADLAETAKGSILGIPVDGSTFRVTVGDQVKISLRTKDVRLAKDRFREADEALMGHWQRLRSAPIDLTRKQTVALAGELYRALVKRFDDDPGPPEWWQAAIELYSAVSLGLEGDDRSEEGYRSSVEMATGAATEALLSDRGLRISSKSRSRLQEELVLAILQGANDLKRRAEGDYGASRFADRFPAWEPPPEVVKPPGAGQSISGLFDLWKADRARNGGAASSARRWKGPVDDFIAFLGHDDAGTVTPQDIIRWKNTTAETGDVSATTFSKVHLASVKAIFSHGVNNLLIDKWSSPASADS